ncbi:DUF4259 domain-containing protein [Streptomyces sp. NPDC060243]|uniref:DUF4259 domain-containing protein n=1 Tax=Streptomyces sp. NPDC060243 TaxID=3347081 RepID=UPI003652FBFF
MAAAALVAAQCPRGEPSTARRPLPDLTAPRPLALEAVDRVLTAPSEPLGLWEGAPSWHGATDRLRAALAPGPVGERASLG